MERRLAAILAADVVGYTKLMGKDEEGTLSVLSLLIEELIDPLIAEHHGRIVKLMGDGILAEFGSVVDAVTCAIAWQGKVTEKKNKIQFRIGINLGEIIFQNDDIFGNGVNIAARLEGLANAGGICVSDDVYRQAKGKLETVFEDMGEQQLKNVEEPVRTYRINISPSDHTFTPPQRHQFKSSPRKWMQIGALATVTLAVVGGATHWFKPWDPQEEPASVELMASPLPDKLSIAVLPFNNISDDSQQEYFVDGLTEDLITDLSQVSGLFVIARHSVFTYKGRAVKVQDVAEDLGVNHVLEGSVRREGERLRINVQLINAISGHHVWAERFDRKLSDVFALQDEVIKKIVTAMKVELTDAEKGGLEKQYTDSIEAYDLFLKGQRAFFEFTREGNQEARDLYREAVELDPKFARAWANLGWTHARDYQDGWSESPEDSLDTALAFAKKGSKLDPTSSQVHWVLGQALLFRQEYERALEAARKAIELSPSNADARILLARILAFAGDPKESARLIEEAMRINPYYPMQYQMNAGIAYFADGNYIKAESALVEAANRNPGAQRVRMWLVATYANAGKIEEAAWELQELMILNPSFSVKSIEHSIPFRDITVRDRLVNGLRLANN